MIDPRSGLTLMGSLATCWLVEWCGGEVFEGCVVAEEGVRLRWPGDAVDGFGSDVVVVAFGDEPRRRLWVEVCSPVVRHTARGATQPTHIAQVVDTADPSGIGTYRKPYCGREQYRWPHRVTASNLSRPSPTALQAAREVKPWRDWRELRRRVSAAVPPTTAAL